MNILILKFMSVIVALTAHNAYGIRVIIKNAKKHYFFYHIHANSIIFATE